MLLCCSKDNDRDVAGGRVTCSTKAVIESFDRIGAFKVSYVYNVTDVDDREGATGADAPPWLEGAQGLAGTRTRAALQLEGGGGSLPHGIRPGPIWPFRASRRGTLQ